MNFTDPHLEALKRRLRITNGTRIGNYWPLTYEALVALVARLDAAEEALSEIQTYHGRLSIDRWKEIRKND